MNHGTYDAAGMESASRLGSGKTLALVRGAALAGVLSGLVLAAALLLGLVPGANRLVFVLVALGGFVFYSIRSSSPGLEAGGSIGVALLATAAGFVSGFGWLEAAAVAGGVGGVAIILLGVDPRVLPFPRSLALVAIALVGLALLPLVLDGGTLGHDESAYALKARSWLEATPDTGWTIHRAPAISAYGYLVLALGGEEPGLRMIGLAALVGLAGATMWFGSRIEGRVTGSAAALIVLAGPAMLRRATEYLTDIPAAALLVLAMGLLWMEFEQRRSGPSFRLLWLLPIAWVAFYLRYQSILAFGLIGLAVLISWWPRIRERPAPVLLTGLVGIAGLVPHAIYSTEALGSPLAVLRFTGDVSGRDYFGEGLVDYALLMGWPLAGLLGLPIVVFFIWWLVRGWADSDSRRKVLFLGIPTVGQVVALGILSHGEARFVFFPLALAAIGAVAGGLDVSSSWSDGVRKGFRMGFLLLIVGSIALSVAATRQSVENRILSNEPAELSADYVEAASQGSSCGAMTSYLPQVTYYSGCYTDGFDTRLPAAEAIERLPGEDRYMILVEEGKRQPTGEDLSELIAETEEGPSLIEGKRDSAEVYRFSFD